MNVAMSPSLPSETWSLPGGQPDVTCPWGHWTKTTQSTLRVICDPNPHRILARERHAGVLGDRTRSVGELQGVGIEAGLQIKNKRPSRRELLVSL
jgi:hypothetical protein